MKKSIFAPEFEKKLLGGNSQNFLKIILKIFVTLGLKILVLLRLKEIFETGIHKC